MMNAIVIYLSIVLVMSLACFVVYGWDKRRAANGSPADADLADRLARAMTDHATPVGSGTVAKTKRIPVEQRAESAVIAWMRHQTTGYDSLVIPRVKGKRREVRRMLAQQSKELLARYRRGERVGVECPLKKALVKQSPTPGQPPA